MKKKDLEELGLKYIEVKEKTQKRLKTYNSMYYKNRKEQILQKAKEKYATNPEYSKKTLENNKKNYRNKVLAKKAMIKDTMNILRHTKNIISLGSSICKLTDDEIKIFQDGFKRFKGYNDLTVHYLSLCNVDSEGYNHGIIGYQISIVEYMQAVEQIIKQNKLQEGKFMEVLEVLLAFCKKYSIDFVEIDNDF